MSGDFRYVSGDFAGMCLGILCVWGFCGDLSEICGDLGIAVYLNLLTGVSIKAAHFHGRLFNLH